MTRKSTESPSPPRPRCQTPFSKPILPGHRTPPPHGGVTSRGYCMTTGVAAPDTDDATQLEQFGYKQELKRALNLFDNFAVAFCYISPVFRFYSLFVLGMSPGVLRYLWLLH